MPDFQASGSVLRGRENMKEDHPQLSLQCWEAMYILFPSSLGGGSTGIVLKQLLYCIMPCADPKQWLYIKKKIKFLQAHH